MGLGSKILDPEKTYSGSRIQGSKRHRIPDPRSGSATLIYTRVQQRLSFPHPPLTPFPPPPVSVT
jgi:hypothetical protein